MQGTTLIPLHILSNKPYKAVINSSAHFTQGSEVRKTVKIHTANS